jgi:hypothetical protein
MQEVIMRIQEVFDILTELGVVQSQMEFSRIWLGKSPRYYSSILARHQQPGIGTLTALAFRLRAVLKHAVNRETYRVLSEIREKLEFHIAVRSITNGPRSSAYR